MNLEKLIEKTLGFLRKYCNLDNDKDIVFEEPYEEPEKILCAAGIYPWNRSDPLFCQPAREGDYVKEAYNLMQNEMKTLRYDEFFKLVEEKVSEKKILIDVGSGDGSYWRNLAKKNKDIMIYLIDKIGKGKLQKELDFERKNKDIIKYTIPFENLTGNDITDDVEGSFNRVLSKNDYNNIIFIQKELSFNDGIPNELIDILRSNNIVFTGFRNNHNLGFITVNEAIRYNPAVFFLSISSLERINPNNMPREFLNFLNTKLNPIEIKKYLDLLHDPRAEINPDKDYKKYDYTINSQKKIGVALKQPVVLYLANKLSEANYNIEIFLNAQLGGPGTYNQPDHFIYAYKN